MKFKVGDRVRIVDIKEAFTLDVNPEFFIGEVGTIISADRECYYPYKIKYDNDLDTSMSKFNEEELEFLEKESSAEDAIALTREQMLKTLSTLLLATFQIDGEFIKCKHDKRKVIDNSFEMQEELADKLGIDLQESYIDHETLEIKKYREL